MFHCTACSLIWSPHPTNRKAKVWYVKGKMVSDLPLARCPDPHNEKD